MTAYSCLHLLPTGLHAMAGRSKDVHHIGSRPEGGHASHGGSLERTRADGTAPRAQRRQDQYGKSLPRDGTTPGHAGQQAPYHRLPDPRRQEGVGQER